MAEIKSFREYIAEQEKIKSQVLSEDAESRASVGENLPVANIELKLTARESKARLDELEEKAAALKRTYSNLDSFVTAPDFDLVGPSDKRALVNITNQKSFQKIFDNWYKSYSDKIGSLRKNREHIKDVDTLRHPGLFNRKAKREQARKNLSDVYSQDKVNAENDKEPKEETTNEEIIYERIVNPFAFASEYASGSRNKYNSSRILTKLTRSKAGKEEDEVGKKGVFGDFDNSKTVSNKGEFEKMRLSYERSAYAVIEKRKKAGLQSLKKAIDSIEDYKVKKKYLKKITDEEYLLSISGYLQNAMNTLYYIGSDLQNLMKDYEKALNKISKELDYQDYKNKKYITNLNAQLAVSKQDKREANKEQKDDRKLEDQEIEAGKAEERKAFHDAIVAATQKDIDAAKNIDQKAAMIFFDILKNASKKGDITPEILLKKLDSESNRKSKDGVKWTDEDRLASVEAIYALAKFLTDNGLKDFQVGQKSSEVNFSEDQTNKLFDLLSPITANIEELVDQTKKLLLTPEGLRKYEDQKMADKHSEELRQESATRDKLKKVIEQELISFIRNNPVSYDSVADRINNDIKNRKKKFSKVNSENLLPEEQEKISAITSYILLRLLKEGKIKNVKEQGLDGAKIEVFNSFEDALKELKKYKEIVDFNKKIKPIAIYYSKRKQSMKTASDLDNNSESNNQKKESPNFEKVNDEISAAKDFNGVKPQKPQAANIFDYAVEKAKKLQER